MSAAQVVELHPAGQRVYTSETEQPANLTRLERLAYVKGYGDGIRRFVKRNGSPGVVHDGPAPAPGTPERVALGVELSRLSREHEAARHPAAHKAGMAALRRYQTRRGLVVTPTARAPRKATSRKAKPVALAAVPTDHGITTEDLAAAGIPGGRVERVTYVPDAPAMPDQSTRVGRKAARQQLAAMMRDQGVKITLDSWAEAKAAHGIR